MTSLARWSIDVDALGRGSIEINGEDVTDRIAEWQAVGQQGGPGLTTLSVRLVPGAATITGEGVVEVALSEVDAGAVVRSWLDDIDGDEIERLALQNDNPHASAWDVWKTALMAFAHVGTDLR